MEKSLMNSSYQHLLGVDPENSAKGGWDPLTSYIETFNFSEDSIKFQGKKVPFGPLLNPPLLLLNVTAPCY